jgi:hypothetical protein
MDTILFLASIVHFYSYTHDILLYTGIKQSWESHQKRATVHRKISSNLFILELFFLL